MGFASEVRAFHPRPLVGCPVRLRRAQVPAVAPAESFGNLPSEYRCDRCNDGKGVQVLRTRTRAYWWHQYGPKLPYLPGYIAVDSPGTLCTAISRLRN